MVFLKQGSEDFLLEICCSFWKMDLTPPPTLNKTLRTRLFILTLFMQILSSSSINQEEIFHYYFLCFIYHCWKFIDTLFDSMDSADWSYTPSWMAMCMTQKRYYIYFRRKVIFGNSQCASTYRILIFIMLIWLSSKNYKAYFNLYGCR